MAPGLLRREHGERIRELVLGGFVFSSPLRGVCQSGRGLLVGGGELRRRLGRAHSLFRGHLLERGSDLQPGLHEWFVDVARERHAGGRHRQLEPCNRSDHRPGQNLEHPLEVDAEPEPADARGEVHAGLRGRRLARGPAERWLAADIRSPCRRGGGERLAGSRGHLVPLAPPPPLLHGGGLDVDGEAEAERVVRALHEGKVGEGFPFGGLWGERDRGFRGLLGRRPLRGELLRGGLLGRCGGGGFGGGQIGLRFLLRGSSLRLRHPLLGLPPPLQDLLRLGAHLRIAIAAHLHAQHGNAHVDRPPP